MIVPTSTRTSARQGLFGSLLGVLCAWAMMLGTVGVASAQEEPLPTPTPGEETSPGEEPSPGEAPQEGPGQPPEPPSAGGPEQVLLPVNDPPFNSWFVEIEDDAPLRGQEENFGEHSAYNFTLAYARGMDPELMRKYAEEAPLIELIQPIRREYQNKLLRFEGRVRRLSKFESTRHLRDVDDIETIYEAWIIPEHEAKPVCYLFTELPEGMEVHQGGRVDYYVAFEGYYFKLMHYESAETKDNGDHVLKRAPLLVGRTLREIPAPERSDSLFLTPTFGVLLFVGFGSIILTGLGFLWWFRRTDRRVQAKLDQKRAESNPFLEATSTTPNAGGEGFERPSSGPGSPGPYLN